MVAISFLFKPSKLKLFAIFVDANFNSVSIKKARISCVYIIPKRVLTIVYVSPTANGWESGSRRYK